MSLKKRWIFTGIIILAYSIIYFITLKNSIYNFGNTYDIIDVISHIIIIVVFGSFLALIIAIFPLKKETYKYKLRLKITLPIGISAITLVLLFLLIYSSIYGKQIIKTVAYESVQVTDSLNCESVKDGKFKITNYTFNRSGHIQTQINLTTLEKKVFTVNWISQCEYILTDTSDTIQKTKVKITEVTTNGYTCFVATNQFALSYHIKRQ